MSSVTTGRYSHLARVLHWASATVVLWATVSGIYMAAWAGPELKTLISSINISVTTLLIPIFAIRVGYRFVSHKPDPLDVPRREQHAAVVGHFLLYALTTVVLLSGVLMMEKDIQVFSWVTLPQPLENHVLNGLFYKVHRASSSLLGLMIVIHIAAVIRHEQRGIRVLRRMTWRLPRRPMLIPARIAQRRVAEEPVRDESGYAVFSHGDAGAVHIAAHRMFDVGRMASGHRLLGRWLNGRTGSGSDWVHLHFHMAVFELQLGKWDAAYSRFREHILPAAATTEDALTDAPGLLWRLQLTAPRPVDLPWQPLQRTALKRMQRPCGPFVELHNLLALAGARDLQNIDRWVRSQPVCDDASRECFLGRMAVALHAYASRTYYRAANAFESLLPQLPQFGGSLAQNQLFKEIAQSSWRLANQAAG